MGIKQLFLILCCGLAAGRSLGQYPIQVMPQLTPPYSLQLNDYYNSTVPKLAVVLTDRDLTRPSINVRLKMTIAGQSATVTTIDNAFYPAVTLDAGIPVRLTGSELAPYFNPDNLSFQGITRAQYASQGQLPEGYYQFCFQAIETTTGRAVSTNSCAMAWLDLSDPPLLNLPSTASNVAFQDPLNIIFSWTPRNSGNPNSAFSTTYDFQLVEITDFPIRPRPAHPAHGTSLCLAGTGAGNEQRTTAKPVQQQRI
jgi:TANFOR domain-containing protein